jgi:hypothetical protein
LLILRLQILRFHHELRTAFEAVWEMQRSVLSLKEEEVVELHRQWTITIVADPSHHWWLKTPSREVIAP